MSEETSTQNMEEKKVVTTRAGMRPPVVLPSKIELTPRAIEEARRVIETQNLQDAYIRLGVKGGGCSGMSYTMNFDKNIGEKDKIFEYEGGVKVAVDVKSFLFLRGMVLDYSDDLIGGGFKFENPNAKRTCSCGSSFSA
ncbi:MAG: HesB/IscA family protein [Candidatus Xenobia bacterium]